MLSDRFGGVRITFWTFLVMIAAVVGVLYLLSARSFAGFFLSFMLLFLTTGVGNGSTYRMIPSIFRTERERKVEGQGEGILAEYVRAGNTADGMANVTLLRDGKVMRYFPIPVGGGSVHVPLAIVDELEPGSGINVTAAAEEPGRLILDVGILEVSTAG